MNTSIQSSQLAELFEDIALTVSGVLSVYEAKDDLVWALCRALGQLYEQRAEVETDISTSVPSGSPSEHPAVVELLRVITDAGGVR